MDLYDGLNSGMGEYLCDRCNIQPLTPWEFDNCVRSGYRYCSECFHFLHLWKWKCDKCNSTGTRRSERILPMIHCGEQVIWLK